MKRELGIARCGLACCLCSENVACKGCKRDGFKELSWCKDAEWCEVRRCGIDKNLNGCFECEPVNCRKGLYAEKIKARAFAEFARRYGVEKLAELFGRDIKTIGKHIGNALKEELKESEVVAKFATTTRHGAIEGKTQTHLTEYYNFTDADFTLEQEKDFLKGAYQNENAMMIACVVDGRIAGNCQISFRTGKKDRHRASVAIALLQEFWNLGIGTRMFEELIRIAKGSDGVCQIELDFIEGNSRARSLYEKMGFRITGVKPDAIRMKDGTFVNEYMMVKRL